MSLHTWARYCTSDDRSLTEGFNSSSQAGRPPRSHPADPISLNENFGIHIKWKNHRKWAPQLTQLHMVLRLFNLQRCKVRCEAWPINRVREQASRMTLGLQIHWSWDDRVVIHVHSKGHRFGLYSSPMLLLWVVCPSTAASQNIQTVSTKNQTIPRKEVGSCIENNITCFTSFLPVDVRENSAGHHQGFGMEPRLSKSYHFQWQSCGPLKKVWPAIWTKLILSTRTRIANDALQQEQKKLFDAPVLRESLNNSYK